MKYKINRQKYLKNKQVMMKHLKQSNAMKTNDLQLERRNFIA